jgi:GntR family transcriptional regulator, transcriptional repressor for pyruvate dehydrogenase complex
MGIEKINLSNEAFNHILAIIAAQGYEPGTKIPSEHELVIMLGVSRNTIRSALNRLNALGILEARHGNGYFLKNVDIDVFSSLQLPIFLEAHSNLETLTEFRMGVEPQGAALAALRAKTEDIESIRKSLDLSQRHLEDKKQFAVFDMDFHLAIAKASGNSIIHRSTEMLKALYTVWLGNFITLHGNAKSDSFHHQIFEAIRAKDADKAREAMTEHLSDVLRKVRLDASRKPRASRAKKYPPNE